MQMITRIFVLLAIIGFCLGGRANVAEALGRMSKAHPRVFVTGQRDFDALNVRAKAVPEIGYMRKILLDEAEAWLGKPPVRGMAGMRMTGEREFAESAATLAAAYRLTGERRFAEKCRDYMLQVCDWPDWNPKHYLDVADMLLGLGWGYDWTYEVLTDAERAKIRTAIVEKGFETRTVAGWWKKASNNWPQVCWGGICIAAVAIADAEPEKARSMIEEALCSLPPCLKVYAPKGAYPEGPGYWCYGTGRFVLMLAAFESAFGTTFGLFETPGFAQTADFIDAMTGPSGKFWNFSDGAEGRRECVCDGWLARKTGRRGILAFDNRAFRKQYAQRNNPKFKPKAGEFLPFRMLWADFSPVSDAAAPLDYASEGGNPVVVMRSSLDENAAYMGLKGGKSCYNHGHMDQGSVLWESDGYRWAIDIGPQNYTKLEQAGVNLWNCGQDGDRWKIYRMNNLSHNLVTVDGLRFCVTGFCNFVSTSFRPDVASATLDLTPAVSPYASRGARRCTLDRRTRVGKVEDGLEGLEPGALVRWALVTPAPYVHVRGRDVVLENLSGKSLTIRCEGPADIVWRLEDMDRPPNPWDNGNGSWTLVSFTVRAGSDGRFKSRVLFIPGGSVTILKDVDVRLEGVLGRRDDEFERCYSLRYAFPLGNYLDELATNRFHEALFVGNVAKVYASGVRELQRRGVKVYVRARTQEDSLRIAALTGADGASLWRSNGIEKVSAALGARSVKIDFKGNNPKR